MSHRQTKSGRCAIVEHIDCKTLDVEHLRERVERRCQSVERIDVFSFCGDFCESEAREIRCDQPVVCGETRNEFAEHERRCWEPVKQQHDRGIWVARCTVEDTDSVRFDLVDGCNRHRKLRKLLRCFGSRPGAFRCWGRTTLTHGSLLRSLLTTPIARERQAKLSNDHHLCLDQLPSVPPSCGRWPARFRPVNLPGRNGHPRPSPQSALATTGRSRDSLRPRGAHRVRPSGTAWAYRSSPTIPRRRPQ